MNRKAETAHRGTMDIHGHEGRVGPARVHRVGRIVLGRAAVYVAVFAWGCNPRYDHKMADLDAADEQPRDSATAAAQTPTDERDDDAQSTGMGAAASAQVQPDESTLRRLLNPECRFGPLYGDDGLFAALSWTSQDASSQLYEGLWVNIDGYMEWRAGYPDECQMVTRHGYMKGRTYEVDDVAVATSRLATLRLCGWEADSEGTKIETIFVRTQDGCRECRIRQSVDPGAHYPPDWKAAKRIINQLIHHACRGPCPVPKRDSP